MNIQSLLIAIISPSILAVLTAAIQNHFRTIEKKKDWEREDEVARRAKVASEQVQGQLRQIHTLVNSNLTASMKGELEATMAKLVVLRKLAGRDLRDNIIVSATDKKEITDTERRVNEMTATLNERLKQTETAEKQRISSST
jgi:hypothetical protein